MVPPPSCRVARLKQNWAIVGQSPSKNLIRNGDVAADFIPLTSDRNGDVTSIAPLSPSRQSG
jgi:hypothetical protein